MFKSFDVVTESMDAFLNEAKITTGNSQIFNFESFTPGMKERMYDYAKSNGISREEFHETIENMDDTSVLPLSNSHASLITASMRYALESYDKEKDQAVLVATDIVAAYNATIDGHFSKAHAEAKKALDHALAYNEFKHDLNDKDSTSTKHFMDQGANAIYTFLAMMEGDRQLIDITEQETKKIIVDAFYDPQDDPEMIKKIIKLRLNYNKTMIKMFTLMLQSNWAVLGMSKDQALALTERIQSEDQETRQHSIKELKELVLKNKDKFDNGKFTDFRSIGGGCIFITKEYHGFNAILSIERLLQESMRYDAIVFGHGGNETKEANRYRVAIEKETLDAKLQIEKLSKTYNVNYRENEKLEGSKETAAQIVEDTKTRLALLKVLQKLPDDSEEVLDMVKELESNTIAYEKHIEAAAKNAVNNEALLEEITKIATEYGAIVAKMNARIAKINKRVGGKAIWTVQEIYTTKAGPFIDMNECIRQLIKEGFKKIKIMSCNPGHHELADDIKKAKGVVISMGKNVFIMENAQLDEDDPYSLLEAAIYRTENDLIETCSRNGFHYCDDGYLDECVLQYDDACQQILTEGTAANIWAKVKELIKSGIGFLVGLFKKMLQMLKNMVNKIKEYFGRVKSKLKSTKLSKPVKSSVIMVENASVKSVNANNLDELEKTAIDACASIIKKINDQERAHISNMEKLQQFAEKHTRSVSENAEMETILNMII